MLYFFCLSQRVNDIVFAASITSAIASRLNKRQVLFVKSKPKFSFQYENLDFVTELPTVLKRQRRSVHEEALFDDDDVYLNVWKNQLRGTYTKGSIESAAVKIANQHIKSLGLRRKITQNDIFKSSRKPSKEKISKDQFLICIDESALNESESDVTSIGTLCSSIDIADFVGCFNTARKYGNFKSVIDPAEYLNFLHHADAIVALSPALLLPYYHSVFDKKVVILQQDDKEYSQFFTDIRHVDAEKIITTLKAFIR